MKLKITLLNILANSSMLIKIDPLIKEKCPSLSLGILKANVTISLTNETLWTEINDLLKQKEELKFEDIKLIPEIESSREGYKSLGKEPSRYRLSAEALHRRIIKGMGLYKINNVVDVINYVSLKTGYSIGGYDADMIKGDILLGLGKSEDIYEAIGRGKLNIENLPVFIDESGPFGSPTSDSVRTMINEKTKNIILIFLNFGQHLSLDMALENTISLLKKYALTTEFKIEIVKK